MKESGTHLRMSKSTLATLIPSIRISPFFSSTIWKMARNRDDFPDPVRPTIPIFSAARVSKDTSLRAYAWPGRYCKWTRRKVIQPCCGHEEAG